LSATNTENHDPTTCYICTRHAVGIGIGNAARDPQWICAECALDLERLRNAKRPSAYELRAREGGMEAAAPLVAEYGPDLSQWEEEQVLAFVGAVWVGCADRLRELITNKEAPF
jgi:hypothetical protein